MELTDLLRLAAGLALAIVAAVVIWRIVARRSRLPSHTPESLQQVAQARYEPDEQPASLISEQIEEMVRAELAQHPDLSGVSLDFGTADDGSLEIWFQGDRYPDPSQLPDERVRGAIQRAVERFNR